MGRTLWLSELPRDNGRRYTLLAVPADARSTRELSVSRLTKVVPPSIIFVFMRASLEGCAPDRRRLATLHRGSFHIGRWDFGGGPAPSERFSTSTIQLIAHLATRVKPLVFLG
jgi:hypothetical protein